MLLNDGVATIFAPVEAGEPGGKPKTKYTENVCASYYGQKTVGVTRYWTAQAHDGRADLLVEIQRFSGVDTSQRVHLAPHVDTGLEGYYKVIQYQHLSDENGLPVTDLTLERIGALDEP